MAVLQKPCSPQRSTRASGEISHPSVAKYTGVKNYRNVRAPMDHVESKTFTVPGCRQHKGQNRTRFMSSHTAVLLPIDRPYMSIPRLLSVTMETTGSVMAWAPQSLHRTWGGRAFFDQQSDHSLLLNGSNPRSSLSPASPTYCSGCLMANAYITGDIHRIIYRILLQTPPALVAQPLEPFIISASSNDLVFAPGQLPSTELIWYGTRFWVQSCHLDLHAFREIR